MLVHISPGEHIILDESSPVSSFYLGVILAVVVSAFFSAAETTLTSISPLRTEQLMEKYPHWRWALSRWHKRPTQILTTILILNNIANITASSLATVLAELLHKDNTVTVVVAVMTPFLVVFGEVIPKTLAKSYAERIVWPVLLGTLCFYYPLWLVTTLLTLFMQGMLWLVGGSLSSSSKITEDELEFLVNRASSDQQASGIGSERLGLLRTIFRFSRTTAREAMRPRTQLESLPLKSTIHQVLEKVRETGYSRILIYKDSVDHICGMAYVKDLLKELTTPKPAPVDSSSASSPIASSPIASSSGAATSSAGKQPPDPQYSDAMLGQLDTLEVLDPSAAAALPGITLPGEDIDLTMDMLRKPPFVPETTRILDILKTLKQKKLRLAVVVDEFGGTAGILTVEDIMEELILELQDEDDQIQPFLIRHERDSTLVDARIEIEDIARWLRITFPETRGYETLNGYLLETADKVPGPDWHTDYANHRFTIHKADASRVREVRITPLQKIQEPGPQGTASQERDPQESASQESASQKEGPQERKNRRWPVHLFRRYPFPELQWLFKRIFRRRR